MEKGINCSQHDVKNCTVIKSFTILNKICKKLNADYGDKVEYAPDVEIWDLYGENEECIGLDYIKGEQLVKDGYRLIMRIWIWNRLVILI